MCSELPTEDARWLAATALKVLLTHASHYCRRVVEVVCEYPYKVLKLVQSSPTRNCPVRQQIASDILSMETSRLHIVARKLKTMFLDELQHAASTGFLKPKLAIPLMELRKTWISHTTQNERINKMLSLFGDRCPYATNDLVSARAMLKHGLSACDTTDAQGKKKAEKKWKTLKPVAQKLSESCLASWDNHAEILSNPERWVPPSATDSQLPSDAALASQMSKLCPKEHSASLVWATCYNMRWTQLVKSSPDVSSTSPWFVIGFGVRESANARKSDFVFYFCAETLGFELTADLIGQVFVCMSLCLMPMFTLSSFIV